MKEQRAALDDSEFIDALLNLVIPPSVDGTFRVRGPSVWHLLWPQRSGPTSCSAR